MYYEEEKKIQVNNKIYKHLMFQSSHKSLDAL